MTAELGQLALILALCAALLGAVGPLLGVLTRNPTLTRMAGPMTLFQMGLGVGAFGLLMYGFVTSDFSILNVARHSQFDLPWYYKASATWGSHEGSMLFWVMCLGLWQVALVWTVKGISETSKAGMLAWLSAIAFGLYAFLIFTSNPFLRLFPPAPDGADLNPLLQDPGMIIHPPLLYIGYVGCAVPCAWALVGLMTGSMDKDWARRMLPWCLAPWVFLTLGIALGSYWSYYELGWGGWWAWDPVENASLLPWLAVTALVHTLLATERRGVFKVDAAAWALLAFGLSLLGTFIVRSGIVSSVHAFSTDPTRGLWLLVIFMIDVAVTWMVFARYAHRISHGTPVVLLSKESFLRWGNMVLLLMIASVLLGTLYPLGMEALGMGKISVGAPYYDRVVGVLALLLAVMIPWAMSVTWTPIAKSKMVRGRLKLLEGLVNIEALWCRRTLIMVSFALIVGAVIPWMMGAWSWQAMAGMSGAVLLGSSVCVLVVYVWRLKHHVSLRFAGAMIAHLGVAILFVGVTLVTHYSTTTEVTMSPGQTEQVGPLLVTFESWQEVEGPNYKAAQATLNVNGHMLQPEKRNYTAAKGMTLSEAALWHRLSHDVYVVLGQPLANNAWTLRISIKEGVLALWLGMLMMALGAFCSAWARLSRRGQGG